MPGERKPAKRPIVRRSVEPEKRPASPPETRVRLMWFSVEGDAREVMMAFDDLNDGAKAILRGMRPKP